MKFLFVTSAALFSYPNSLAICSRWNRNRCESNGHQNAREYFRCDCIEQRKRRREMLVEINTIHVQLLKQTYRSLTCNKYDIKQYAAQLCMKLFCAVLNGSPSGSPYSSTKYSRKLLLECLRIWCKDTVFNMGSISPLSFDKHTILYGRTQRLTFSSSQISLKTLKMVEEMS